MILAIILLGIFAVICNALMDEIDFHWYRLFEKIFPPGSKCESWFNPSISWKNKYSTNSKFLNFLLSTVLVFVTDFWHCLKFLFLSCIWLIIMFLAEPGAGAGEYALGVVLLHLAWGFIFELTMGILGAISDTKK